MHVEDEFHLLLAAFFIDAICQGLPVMVTFQKVMKLML